MDLNNKKMITYPYYVGNWGRYKEKIYPIEDIIYVKEHIEKNPKMNTMPKYYDNGYFNRRGELIVKPSNDRQAVVAGGPILIYKKKNKVKITKEGKVKIIKEGEVKIIKEGKLVAEFDSFTSSRSLNWSVVSRKNEVFFFNVNTLKKLLKESFEKALPFHKNNNVTFVKKFGKWHIINKKGIYLRKNLDIDDAEYIYKEFIRVRKSGKWGLMNIFGEYILPCKYENKLWVSLKGRKKFAYMRKGGKMKFVDLESGEFIKLIK